MSIEEITVYKALCDKCNRKLKDCEWFSSWYALLKALQEAGWLYDAGQEITICKGCREEI